MPVEVLAGTIFVVMYMFIISEKIHRTIIAMIGASTNLIVAERGHQITFMNY